MQQNGLWLYHHEILQKDAYFNTPIKYFFTEDKQLEILLTKVFQETSDEISDEPRYHLLSNMLRFIYHKKKIAIFF